MSLLLTNGTQSVQAALAKKGVNCRILELPTSTRTAIDAATSIGCDVSQIAKSLIFRTLETRRPILICVSGSNRVSETIIESHIGEKITKADAAFTKETTGFTIGGIPPIGHKQPIDLIFIDKDLLKFESIWAAAGTQNAVFNITSTDLLAITNAKIIAIR